MQSKNYEWDGKLQPHLLTKEVSNDYIFVPNRKTYRNPGAIVQLLGSRLMLNLKIFMSMISLMTISSFTFAIDNEQVQARLAERLERYSIDYKTYSSNNYPVLTGNREMGGLVDPLGRGVFNIEIADLFINESFRVAGPGMMVHIAQFGGQEPTNYRQTYNLATGIVDTRVEYANGGYRSELFFSMADRTLMVFSLQNTGSSTIVCNIDMGRYGLNLQSHTDKSFYAVSPKSDFTRLHYSLQSNIPLTMWYFPNLHDAYLHIPAGETLHIILRLQTGDVIDAQKTITSSLTDLKAAHINSWKACWQAMGTVLLPNGDYARTFYRSLHWLQCTAGASHSLPGEQQFAQISTALAETYNYHGQIYLNLSAWENNPFTYGAAGWALQAYTMFGNQKEADLMLHNFYRPDILKKNVTTMFPVGKHEYVYGNKPQGQYDYLKGDFSSAYAFAHEQNHDGSSRGEEPWDQQVHIQAFGPSLFYRYNRFFNACTDTTYDVMRGSAEFWSALLNYDHIRKTYSVPPLLSLTEDLFKADLLDAQLSAKWVLTEAARMAEKRSSDVELRKKWLNIAKNIKIPDRDNVYLEYANDDGSRAGAGYQGIRGYAYLGFPTLELMPLFPKNKVNKSLDVCWQRNKKGAGMITFVANWFALTDAYWGRGEAALEKMAYSLTQLDPSGTAMCEQNKTLYYFLTGYASYVMVPIAMALQSVDDEIKVFPAVPKAFANMEFYNLPANDGIRVSGVLQDGKTQKVWFEKDGKCLLTVSGRDNVVVINRKGQLKMK